MAEIWLQKNYVVQVSAVYQNSRQGRVLHGQMEPHVKNVLFA